jgi:small subunit ribosomal protein S18
MQGPTEASKSLESKEKPKSGAMGTPSTGYPMRRAPSPRDDDGVGGGLDGPGLEGGDRQKRYSQVSDRSRCRFCREKLTRVDYKDVLTLQKLCTSQGRIFSRKRSGNCAHHQRQVKLAVKQARFIGLLNYTV